jgi:hypothetical protein
MSKINKIKEALNKLEPEFKLPLWNIYCTETNQNLEIYDNDENFFETFYSDNVIGAVQRAVNGEYKFHDDYVRIDNYGNFESFDYEDLDNYIDVDEIAEFLNENEEYLSELMNLEEEEENEVSEEEYYDALEVLPPFYFDTLNGKKVSGGFAVGEPTSHKQTPDGMKATYSGFYKSGDKYFGVGQVYFLNTDSYGEPNGYSDDTREAKTLVPDAFAKGGSIFKSLQDFGNWFMGSRKQYPTGRAWSKEHYNDNADEDYEVDPNKRKVRARNRKFELGGGVGNRLIGNQARIDMNKNGRIDAEDFKILRTTMNGAWRNEHKHVNHSEDHEKRYARKNNPARTGYKGRKEYGNGGGVPKQPIEFETSNLLFNGYGVDINGNKVVRVSFSNSRAFSISTQGLLPKTYKLHNSLNFDEKEINNYVKEFGTESQKKKLKIYK